jgi:hypothetical protein
MMMTTRNLAKNRGLGIRWKAKVFKPFLLLIPSSTTILPLRGGDIIHTFHIHQEQNKVVENKK